MRSLFWGAFALFIAWSAAFGAYTYYVYNLTYGSESFLPVGIANLLTWLVGILFFGLLALILKPAARDP